MAEVLGLTDQAAVGFGLGDLPAPLARGLHGIRDTLKGQQAAVTHADEHAIGGHNGQRIGVLAVDDLVLAIECRHLLLQR